jgi:large subunit ribosomal protein L13
MSTQTVRIKAAEIYKDWHVIDAAGRPLGRVATEAATLLRGKHKPTFEPHLDGGDFVIVINASKVKVGGNKSQVMRYYRHSGYPGGLKSRNFEEQLAAFPDRVIEQAVWGMLPSGPLGEKMLKHLKVYPGPKHPHESQIVGSERSKEAREAAQAEAIAARQAKPPRRLRPLSIPDGSVVEVVEVEPVAAAPAPATAKAPKDEPKAKEEATPDEEPAVEVENEVDDTAAEETKE